MREYYFEYQIMRYLTEPLPIGPELEEPDGSSLTVYRHREGNLKAKRDLEFAPYPSKYCDGRDVWSWKRGEYSSTVLHTTSRFAEELTGLFEVGRDVETRHIVLAGDTAYGKRIFDGMPELKRENEGAHRIVLASVTAFLDNLDRRNPVPFLYLNERGRWDVFRAVEGLKERGSARCVAVVGDSLFLEGEPEASWAERFGLKLC